MFVRHECRGLLAHNAVETELVDVDEAVRCLLAVIESTERFVHNDCFDFGAHINVGEAPPGLRLTVKYERVVVAALSSSVVDQNRMEVVRDVAVVLEGVLDIALELGDLLLDLLFSLDHGILVALNGLDGGLLLIRLEVNSF